MATTNHRNLNMNTAITSQGSLATLVIFLLAIVAVAIGAPPAAHALPLPTYSYVASDDVDGDAVWENTGTMAGLDFTIGGGPLSPVTGINDGLTDITAAYQYPAAIATTPAFSAGLRGAVASFELWFRASDLTGEHLLYEAGGSTGTSFLLDGSTLRFATRGTVQLDTSVALGPQTTSRFRQAVGVISTIGGGAAAIQLYLDGVPVDSAAVGSGHSGIWAGTDLSGLGAPGGGTAYAGDTFITSLSDYDGQIGVFNFYDSALSVAEVSEAYSAFVFDPNAVPEPSTFVLLSVGVLALVRRSRRRGRK